MNGMIGDRLRKWLGGSSRAAEGEAAAENGGRPAQLAPDGYSRSADKGPDEKNPADAGMVGNDDQAHAPGDGRLGLAAQAGAHQEAEALEDRPAQAA